MDQQPHMDAWLSKPVDPKTLLAKVSKLLQPHLADDRRPMACHTRSSAICHQLSAGSQRRVTADQILIVDDDADFREFVRIVLESHGYTVVEADNGAAGLTAARDELPSLVLLDAMMSYELAGSDHPDATR